ncbi:MAG: hypothetical protein AAF408_06110 [Pseudomonadota bacterium]
MTDYQAHREVLEAEASVRSHLRALDEQLMAVRSQDAELDNYRCSGADVLWHSWQARSRRALNTDLARARAARQEVLDQLRASFGRQRAVNDLVTAQARDARAKFRDQHQKEVLGRTCLKLKKRL